MTATIGYTSTGLLSRFNLWAGRPDSVTNPSAVDAIPDAVKYMYLADGEQYTIGRISSISAKILYGAPRAMQTSDGGLTWTFGYDDDGNLMFPMGRTSIYTALACLPSFALRPDYDYLDEGTRIRCMNNVPITGPLYWYGLQPTGQMSATNQPVLQPAPMNVLSVIKAVAAFAEAGNIRNAALSDRMTLRYEREFGPLMTLVRKHLRGSGPGGRLLSPFAAAFGPSLSTAMSA